MITDVRPLEPEFVPGDVRHRDGEVDALTSTLEPILDGTYAEPALLYGPSGTGKTCIARYTVERLHEQVLDVTTKYVNCWENYSRFKVLQEALEAVDAALDVHRQSTPRDELLNRLREGRHRPYVLVLDEVDQLEEKGVLYDLHRTGGLSLVLIANSEEELFAQLEERVASRLQTATRIRFDRYGTDELVAILHDRVRWGLHEDAATDAQLRYIAEAAGGDARVAIGTLRAAAHATDKQGRERLTDDLIEEAVPEAKSEIRRRSLEKLTDDQRTIYDIICNHDGIRPDALYEEYRRRVDDPRTRRTTRNYLKKMRRYNLVEVDGRGKAREYHPVS